MKQYICRHLLDAHQTIDPQNSLEEAWNEYEGNWGDDFDDVVFYEVELLHVILEKKIVPVAQAIPKATNKLPK